MRAYTEVYGITPTMAAQEQHDNPKRNELRFQDAFYGFSVGNDTMKTYFNELWDKMSLNHKGIFGNYTI